MIFSFQWQHIGYTMAARLGPDLCAVGFCLTPRLDTASLAPTSHGISVSNFSNCHNLGIDLGRSQKARPRKGSLGKRESVLELEPEHVFVNIYTLSFQNPKKNRLWTNNQVSGGKTWFSQNPGFRRCRWCVIFLIKVAELLHNTTCKVLSR